MPPILLLTRPAPQSRRFAERAKTDLPAHEAWIAPLSEVVALPFDPAVFDGAAGVVLTSANAVAMLPPLPGMRAWCVGAATARAAGAAGLAPVEGGGDAAALIETLARERPAGRLIHAHGRHLARDLGAALRPRGIDMASVAVYEARALAWPDATRSALLAALQSDRAVMAPLFSPRAALGFARAIARIAPASPASRLRIVAISRNCADALPARLQALVTIAETPDADGLMRALRGAMSHSPRFA